MMTCCGENLLPSFPEILLNAGNDETSSFDSNSPSFNKTGLRPTRVVLMTKKNRGNSIKSLFTKNNNVGPPKRKLDDLVKYEMDPNYLIPKELTTTLEKGTPLVIIDCL